MISSIAYSNYPIPNRNIGYTEVRKAISVWLIQTTRRQQRNQVHLLDERKKGVAVRSTSSLFTRVIIFT